MPLLRPCQSLGPTVPCLSMPQMRRSKGEELTRTLWDPEGYVDGESTADMLPISREEAGYLVDVFLLHHVVELAVAADSEAAESRP